jgi:long-chain acyl-CoA synthetase
MSDLLFPYTSLDEAVTRSAELYPNKIMIRDASVGESVSEYTYAQGNRLINNLAAQVAQFSTNVVGVMLTTSFECVCLIYAVIRTGKDVVLIDPEWGDLAQSSIQKEAGIGAVISATEVQGPLIDFWQIIDWQSKAAFDASSYRAASSRLIIFTSGTTSKPKGIVLSQASMLYAYKVGQECLGIGPNTNAGCFYRVSGLGILGIHFLFPLLYGGSVTIMDRFSYSIPDQFWSEVQRHKVNFLYIVPPIANFLVKEGHQLQHRFSIDDLLCVSGAARLDPEIQKSFQEKFAPLANIYGLSECGFAFLFGNRAGEFYDNSVGPAVGLELKLLDSRGNIINIPYTEGRLFVKTDSLFSGYLHNIELTKEVVQDGWLDTRDLAYFDENKCANLVGRVDGTINKGGNLFHLAECEEALCLLPDVIEAACLKVECDLYGEDYAAIVRVRDEIIDKFTYIDYLSQALGSGRVPKALAITTKELPRNGAGKYDRARLEVLLES